MNYPRGDPGMIDHPSFGPLPADSAGYGYAFSPGWSVSMPIAARVGENGVAGAGLT